MIKILLIGLVGYLLIPPLFEKLLVYKERWNHFHKKKLVTASWYKTYLIAKDQIHLEKQALAFLFIFSLWVIHAFVIFGKMNVHGLVPRSIKGVIGIFTSCLFHGGLDHLFSNSIGLIVFLPIFIFVRRNNIFTCLFMMILFKGVLAWFLARSGVTIGASGLIYAIWGYLILNGVLSKDLSKLFLSLALAVPTAFMFKGMNPLYVGATVSFEGHFFGMLAGFMVAWICFDRDKHDWIDLEAEVPLTSI